MRAALGIVLTCSVVFGCLAGAHAAGSAINAPLQLPLDGETTSPNWRTPPSGDDLQREYPPLAQMMQINGGATIKCSVEVDGRVDECHVVSEYPVGLGFGAAAVRSAVYFSMKPATLDGKAVVGEVTIPLTFKLQNNEPAAESPIPAPTSPGALEAARQVFALQDLASRLRMQWQLMIEQMSARVVLENQAQSGEAALDAFRQGLDETLIDEVDRQARLLASRMSETDLRATVAYLESPAGKAWVAATSTADPKCLPRKESG